MCSTSLSISIIDGCVPIFSFSIINGCSIVLICWFIKKEFPTITNKLFHSCKKKKNHFLKFRLKVFFVLQFLKFSFHCQSTMNVDSQNVCMNGVKRWGGICFVYN